MREEQNGRAQNREKLPRLLRACRRESCRVCSARLTQHLFAAPPLLEKEPFQRLSDLAILLAVITLF